MFRKKIAENLSENKFIIKIMENPADLSEFKGRPTPRLITGLVLMAFSYVIGWPAMVALSVLAIWMKKPLIAIIGCPTIYSFSYVLFILGAWLARAPHYIGTLARYTIQSFLKKLIS